MRTELRPLFREHWIERALSWAYVSGYSGAEKALDEYCGARNLLWKEHYDGFVNIRHEPADESVLRRAL